MSRLKRLIHEIHQRSLWQILLIYIGVSWGVLEAADLFAERLGLADWLFWVALGLLVTGLVILLVLAFLPEPAVSPMEPHELHLVGARRRPLLTWRRAATIFVVALAAWGVVAAGWILLAERGTPSDETRRSIAVLPFDNLSPDPENEYFADGMHDEIIARLSLVADLKVISRTSVMEYKDRKENLRAIAAELGVTNILEGTVRRANGQVRITTQLIDALSDDHLWTEVYDRDLSDLFAVQSDVAQQVATALRATLTPAERGRIEERPTENLEAYDYYVRGIEYLGRPGVRPENYQNAQRMLEQAVELDPRFALAHAVLSLLHADAYEYALDRSEERLLQAGEAARRALEIDPDLSEGHLALGSYYHAVRDLDLALEELAIAERGLPGSARLAWVRGFILERRGKWEEALASQERALALSPREPSLLYALGVTYASLRRYEEAEHFIDRALALQPDAVEKALVKAMVPTFSRGDTGPLRTFVEGIPPGFDPWGMVTWLRWSLEYVDRDYAAALEVLSNSELEYIEFPGPEGSGSGPSSPRTLMMGLCYTAMGETDRARAAADSARRDLETRLRERPDDPQLHRALSGAHAVLGHKEEAIQAAQRAVALLPISKDAVDGPDFVRNLAATYAWFGEVDAAVEQFDRYLSVPASPPYSIESILLDPAIDPVRDDPRFRALVAKYE